MTVSGCPSGRSAGRNICEPLGKTRRDSRRASNPRFTVSKPLCLKTQRFETLGVKLCAFSQAALRARPRESARLDAGLLEGCCRLCELIRSGPAYGRWASFIDAFHRNAPCAARRYGLSCLIRA